MIARSSIQNPSSAAPTAGELRLARAAASVTRSLELDDVQRAILRQAMALTGAGKAALASVERRTGEVRLAACSGFSEAFTAPPLSRAVLQRVGDAGADQRALMRREGVMALMHAPLELGPQRLGVVSVGSEDPGRFGEEQLGLLSQIASWGAQAWDNACEFERERRLARALTLGFVPESLPHLPGYETGLLYAPASNEGVGGDVYGAWTLPGGQTALLLGDVAGEGVEKAALSAMVRFFVEAHSWQALSPAATLERTNAMLLARLPSDTFVTAFFGVLEERCLRYTLAGHPPPLIVPSSRGELRSHGLPLGVDSQPGYGESEVALAPGDLLFAYTDGLVEARRAGEMFGVERLRRLVAGWAGILAPQALTAAVHEEVSEWAGGLSDDAVALALRRRS